MELSCPPRTHHSPQIFTCSPTWKLFETTPVGIYRFISFIIFGELGAKVFLQKIFSTSLYGTPVMHMLAHVCCPTRLCSIFFILFFYLLLIVKKFNCPKLKFTDFFLLLIFDIEIYSEYFILVIVLFSSRNSV